MGKCAIAGIECPKTNNKAEKRFCPAWTDGVVWRNTQTGEERVVNCSFEAMMPALVEVVAASNRPAAAVESTRNEIAEGFSRLTRVMAAGIAIASEGQQAAIEDNSKERSNAHS